MDHLVLFPGWLESPLLAPSLFLFLGLPEFSGCVLAESYQILFPYQWNRSRQTVGLLNSKAFSPSFLTTNIASEQELPRLKPCCPSSRFIILHSLFAMMAVVSLRWVFFFFKYYTRFRTSAITMESIISIVIFLGKFFTGVVSHCLPLKESDYRRSNICSESGLNPR